MLASSIGLRAKATDIVQKLDNGGKLADEAASVGVKFSPHAGRASRSVF